MKQINNIPVQVWFLINSEKEDIVRDFLTKYKVIILSLAKYTLDQKSFWNTYLHISTENDKKVILLISDTKIQENVKNFAQVWFEITNISNSENSFVIKTL